MFSVTGAKLQVLKLAVFFTFSANYVIANTAKMFPNESWGAIQDVMSVYVKMAYDKSSNYSNLP